MANDILALGGDDLQPPDTPRRTEALKPRAVPELDEDLAMALSFNGSPLASDFFTSARSKPKKHRWRLTR